MIVRSVASILLCVLSYVSWSQADTLPRAIESYYHTILPTKIRARFTTQILPQHSLSKVLDNYIDDAHVHLETTANYDQANPYLTAFTGSSYKWTKYYYDGLRIDNPLLAGDASFHIPLIGSDLEINSIAGSISISPQDKGTKGVHIMGSRGDLGGRIGFTDWFLNNISGHRSAGERAIFDIKLRPYTSWFTEVVYHDEIGIGEHKRPILLSVNAGNRVHIDQDYNGSNTAYDEEYLNILGAGTLYNKNYIFGEGIQYLVSYSEREHYGAEYQYDRDETSKLVQLNASIYSKKHFLKGQQILALQINALRKASVNSSFSRNVIDQDGEGLHPYDQDGRQQSYGIYYRRNHRYTDHIGLQVECLNTLINHRPQTATFSSPVYRQSTDYNYRSLHVIDWEASPFVAGLLENNVTSTYKTKGQNATIKATIGLHLLGMLVSENSLISISPSVDFAWHRALSKKWSMGARLGIHPNRYDVDQIRFLSPDYLNGKAYYWDDANNNRNVGATERGALAYTTGGAYHKKADDLGVSHTYFLDIPFTYKASDRWEWTLVAQYRQYRNTWGVEYDKPILEYGKYQNKGGRDFWFADGGETYYEVQPLSRERMNSRGGDTESFLFDQPFYAGGTFRFEHNSRRWFFSGSFTANMVVGFAGMGNGPLHNNINAPSESLADPNLRENQLGRLDSDRSFISRIIASYKYSDRGSVGVMLKYKDGQSFAYYDHYLDDSSKGTSIAYHQPEVRGDNPLIAVMGRREDFFTNLEVNGKHSFPMSSGTLTLGVTLHNLLDFANETSEYIFGNIEGFSRSPLELHVPRSASVTVGWSWR